MSGRVEQMVGGLAAVLAHPDDESFGCAGALALAYDAERPTRLLVATRGEASVPEGGVDGDFGEIRLAELRCAAPKIGLDEVSILDGYPDGALAEATFSRLVEDIASWLEDRRPSAVITFGAHGITGHPDHVVVGAATRWAIERLSEQGNAPHAVYVIAPVFGPNTKRYDLSAEEGAATHRIDITPVAGRKLAALACHATQPDAAEEIAALREALDRDGVLFEGYNRVRPAVPAPHPKFDTRLV